MSSNGNEFPVGWSTFQEDLRLPNGHITIVVVDDYTSYCLWDELFYGLQAIGSKPIGWTDKAAADLPEGKWNMVNAKHSMGSDALYGKAGITKPTFEQLPAVYAITHGSPTGRYVLQVHKDAAVEFIKTQLANQSE